MPEGALADVQWDGSELRVFVVLPAGVSNRIDVLATHDRTQVALRSTNPLVPDDLCQGGDDAVGGGRAVFSTRDLTDDGHFDERHYVVDPAANIWSTPSFKANRVLTGGAQQFEISASTYVAVLSPSSKLEVYEDGRSNTLRGLGIPQSTFLVGRDVFWEDWTGGYVVRIYHGTVDGPGTVFFATPDGSDLKSFATDGVDMAWTQGYGVLPGGVTFERYELWTAPYTTDAAALRPRKVLDLESEPTLAVIGEGWYAFSGGDPSELIRLSDGHRKRLACLADAWDAEVPAFVAGGVLGVPGRRRAVGRFETTLFVVPIDAIPDI